MRYPNWFRLYEKKLHELDEEGVDPDFVDSLAAEWATKEQAEQYADMLRQRRKEEGK